MMPKPEKYKAFLDELTALGRKHGFVLWSCGCCWAIVIEKMDDKKRLQEYGCDEHGQCLELDKSNG